MSERPTAPNPPSHRPSDASALPRETQSQRWMKYGSNVALTIVLIVVIAALITYIAQRHDRRIDMTAGGAFSLKPQTRSVIDGLNTKVTLVSLYTHTRPQTASEDQDSTAATTTADPAQTVADLLEEYHRNGKNIDVEVIDPVTEKDKLARLHETLVQQYGSQIQSYKDFLAEWDKQYKEFEKLTTAESAAMTAVAGGGAVGEDESSSASGFSPDVVRTIKGLPRSLANMKRDLDEERSRKYPDWKAAASSVKDYLSRLSELSGNLAGQFSKLKDQKDVPDNIRQYMAQSQPRYEQIKKAADDLIVRQGKLGELKVDQLEQALNVNNPVLVLGPNEWRVLQYSQLWPEDTDLRNMVNGTVRPRFAGEQQVTAAIYSLTTNKKPKLCFVRPGGEPVTAAGFPPFIPSGIMSQIAERMRQYNFDITEKDLSGTWAMQAQMRQMPSAPEPSDEEIKDAIWVVLDMPKSFSAGQQQEGMPPAPIGPKVQEHLDHGGSALILFEYQAEDLRAALDSWGIRIHPDALAVHPPIKLTTGSPTDLVEDFKSRPMAFVVKDYGDHIITHPLQSLESIWVPTMCVSTQPAKDASPVPLVPMDKAYGGLQVWGETDIEAIRPDAPPTFDPIKDLSPPIYGMAVSEKKNGGRVVVIGSPIMFNGRINIPDPTIAQTQRRFVNRFPGNGELAANSLFWLAHLEPMISISPAAMDVSRITDMSKGALNFWRYGVLLVLLPGAIVAAGLAVYSARRD